MSKYKVTLLSPIHISSGEEFEKKFNLLEDSNFVYLYDEFKLVEFFIAQNINIPIGLENLKKLIQKYKDKIISSNLHIRKIEKSFATLSKPLLGNITTANRVIISGSSIKGGLRTAILDCMRANLSECKGLLKECEDKTFDKDRFVKNRFDKDLANIFKYLKVTDTNISLETKVYKTINVKREKSHQQSREKKVEEISNYIEAIKPNQIFEIEITDTHENKIFKHIASICNKFYIPFFVNDEKHYATQSGYIKNKVNKLSKDMFLLNIGRFSGAELKSLNELRNIKASKAEDKSITLARTFALEKFAKDTIYFENELFPFGWMLFEKIEKRDSEIEEFRTKRVAHTANEENIRFRAIDELNIQQKQNELKVKEEIIKKRKIKETEERAKEEANRKREEALSTMSPIERIIEELIEVNPNKSETRDIVIFNAIKNGKLNEFKKEALYILKEEMIKSKKWVEKSKKPKKDKKYKRTLEVMKMIEELSK